MVATVLEAIKGNGVINRLPALKLPRESFIHSLPPEDQVLLTRLLIEPAFFVDHPDFKKAKTEKAIFGIRSKLVQRNATRFVEAADEITDAVSAGERVPTLTHEQEKHLFMRFNFARRQITRMLEDHANKPLTAAATRCLLAWGHRVLTTRGVIVRVNLPLVLAMAKRTRLTHIDFNEMISEGNMALLRSVEKFDCGRGFKFSTYSCRAILKSFSRVAMRASRYRGRFPTEFDPTMERSDYVDTKRAGVKADCVDELKEILVANVADLSTVELTVINERFAIGKHEYGGDTAPKTLEQVGHLIGVTKERVRQIQNKALKKIRLALEEQYLAA